VASDLPGAPRSGAPGPGARRWLGDPSGTRPAHRRRTCWSSPLDDPARRSTRCSRPSPNPATGSRSAPRDRPPTRRRVSDIRRARGDLDTEGTLAERHPRIAGVLTALLAPSTRSCWQLRWWRSPGPAEPSPDERVLLRLARRSRRGTAGDRRRRRVRPEALDRRLAAARRDGDAPPLAASRPTSPRRPESRSDDPPHSAESERCRRSAVGQGRPATRTRSRGRRRSPPPCAPCARHPPVRRCLGRGRIRSAEPQTTVTGTSTPSSNPRVSIACRSPSSSVPSSAGQGLVHPVEPLEAQQVVDQLTGDQCGVREQPSDQRFELPPGGCRRETPQVLRVGVGRVAGRERAGSAMPPVPAWSGPPPPRLRRRASVPRGARGRSRAHRGTRRRCQPGRPTTRRPLPCPTHRARAGRARAPRGARRAAAARTATSSCRRRIRARARPDHRPAPPRSA
jgi:hypothetical protein